MKIADEATDALGRPRRETQDTSNLKRPGHRSLTYTINLNAEEHEVFYALSPVQRGDLLKRGLARIRREQIEARGG